MFFILEKVVRKKFENRGFVNSLGFLIFRVVSATRSSQSHWLRLMQWF